MGFVNGLSAPDDPNVVIDDIADVFCPKGLTVMQKLILKGILTGGGPDSAWSSAYGNYLADPGNATLASTVRTKVDQVLYNVFQMPEYHVM
ncbi:MAG: hypothetical protein EP322_08235 [Bacteroidetes bacterium]|nr:MAG: hypothetical protein EP322_08235 [Bacteroidota bacterium]